MGFHQGVVTAWDSTTNQNTILIAGSEIPDIPALSIGDSIMMSVGDIVGLLRFKSTYFILGRITLPGVSNAFGIRAASDSATGFTNSTTFGDLSVGSGPTVSNVKIGTARRCLVMLSTGASADVNSRATAHFAVSGDSTIAPPSGAGSHSKGAFVGSDTGGGADVTSVSGSATRTFLLTAANGLNAGLNTFTMKYASLTGDDAFFYERTIVVFPF